MALHTRRRELIGGWERTGGGRVPERPSRFERREPFRPQNNPGSHMPLDTEAHWSWRNPLNIIPAALLLVTIMALGKLLIAAFF